MALITISSAIFSMAFLQPVNARTANKTMYSLFIRKIRSSKITIKLHPGNREGGLIGIIKPEKEIEPVNREIRGKPYYFLPHLFVGYACCYERKSLGKSGNNQASQKTFVPYDSSGLQ